ncbi:MAG: hypothetical protein AAFV53_26455 [Myxococcota bacterium]
MVSRFSERHLVHTTLKVCGELIGETPTPLSGEHDIAEEGFISGLEIVNSLSRHHIGLFCERGAAHRTTQKIFALDAGAVSEDDIRDCLGEVINLIGGYLQQYFHQETMLTAPTVSTIHHDTPVPSHGPILCQAWFTVDGGSFNVWISDQHTTVAQATAEGTP